MSNIVPLIEAISKNVFSNNLSPSSVSETITIKINKKGSLSRYL